MKTFSQEAWASIDQTIYKDILNLDFVKELMLGTLDKSTFEFYIKQDKLYLNEFRRILTILSSKLIKEEESNNFLIYAKDIMDVEKELHEEFLDLFKADEYLEASPSCLLYTGYLHTIVNTSSVAVILASVLPCFWIYQELGAYILKHQNKEDNIYQAWIDTYGSSEYEKVVQDVIVICNKHEKNASKDEKDQMLQAFYKASQMEWLFWDSAYKKEKWAI